MSWIATEPRSRRIVAPAIALLALTITVIGWTAASVAGISSVRLASETVTAGGSSTGLVTVDATTNPPVTVSLTSANTSVATVPASVLVGSRRQGSFQVKTASGAAGCTTIRASLGNSTKTAFIAVQPPPTPSSSPIKVTVAQPTVVGGATINGTVALPTAKSASVVQLSSSNPSLATVPSSINVPLTTGDVQFGAAYFPITTRATGTTMCVVITATQGNASSRVLLRIEPIGG